MSVRCAKAKRRLRRIDHDSMPRRGRIESIGADGVDGKSGSKNLEGNIPLEMRKYSPCEICRFPCPPGRWFYVLEVERFR